MATTPAATQERRNRERSRLCTFACSSSRALQFVIAYQNIDLSQMFTRMLVVACVEAGAGGFVLHASLVREADLSLFVVIFTVSVLLGMQYGWTDSFRMLVGARCIPKDVSL